MTRLIPTTAELVIHLKEGDYYRMSQVIDRLEAHAKALELAQKALEHLNVRQGHTQAQYTGYPGCSCIGCEALAAIKEVAG